MSFIELKNISKSFDDVKALKGASLKLEELQIHVLLGENGAGKTTLMRVLYGMIIPDAGEIFIDGNKVILKKTRDAMHYGIGMVHQHFMLVENMTVYENIAIGFESRKNFFFDKNQVLQKIKLLSDELKFYIDPHAYISDLTVGQKQRIEILKDIYRNSKTIILDEPTAVLTPQEVAILFNILNILKLKGTNIVMITHKLKECLEIADKISVMRGGSCVATDILPKDVTTQDLADLMIGRNVDLNIKRRSQCITDQYVVEVEELNLKKDKKYILNNISLKVRKGEILGVAGVEGNGQLELEEVLSGNLKPTSMKMKLYGKDISGNTKHMIDNGIALIPEDRSQTGLVTDLSIADNIILGYHRTKQFVSHNIFKSKIWRAFAKKCIDEYDIKATNSQTITSTLSGGNQQKIVVARVLSQSPKFLVCAQPTRGVDVGSINYIHNRILDYRDNGNAIILFSADLDEVRSLSDKIIVMFEGKIVADKISDDFTESELGSLMLTGESS